MAEDWQENWTVAMCEQCGDIKRCQLVSDPFIGEVYDGVTPSAWWCYDCWDVRKGDV